MKTFIGQNQKCDPSKVSDALELALATLQQLNTRADNLREYAIGWNEKGYDYSNCPKDRADCDDIFEESAVVKALASTLYHQLDELTDIAWQESNK